MFCIDTFQGLKLDLCTPPFRYHLIGLGIKSEQLPLSMDYYNKFSERMKSRLPFHILTKL